jgi:ABC-2 type transport system permease protein
MGAWEITKKDLKLLLRDRRAVVLLLVLPLSFITILGLSTGQLLGWRDENQLLKIAIVNEDHEALSGEVVQALEKREGLKVFTIARREAAQQLVDRGDATAAIVIGPAFHERVDELTLGDILDTRHGELAGGLASLEMEVLRKPSFASAGAIITDLVFADTLRTLAPHIARKNPLAAKMMDRAQARQEEEGQTAPEAAKTTTSAAPKTGGNQVYQQLVPAYTVLFMFFLVNIMARSFLSERDLGTLRRLRISPISPVSLLSGKTLPFLTISLAQCLVLFVAGKFLFGMSWGAQPLLLLPVILCTSLSATTLGLLAATLVRTDSQVSAYSNFVVITMAGISGCFMPREWLPQVMQQASLITPHAWALIAFNQLLAQPRADLRIVLESCLALAGFAATYFTCGWFRFRGLE